MVIGPTEAKKQITIADRAKSEALEEKIDSFIKTRYDGGDTMTVDVNYGDLPRKFALEELFGKYKTAGWTSAQVISDQRDGTYVQLSARTSSVNDCRDWASSSYDR